MRLRAVLVLLVATAANGASGPARAQPATAVEEEARAKFKAAQQTYDRGDYAAALPMFRDVHAAVSSPNARLYIARCLRELGRLPEAYDEMSATFLDAAARAEREPRFAATRDAAAAERAAMERKVGRVVVAVASPPAGLEVVLGETRLDPARVGKVVAIEPGTVRVRATAPGRVPAEAERTVAAGTIETIALVLQPELQPEPSPPPVVAVAPPPREPEPPREAPEPSWTEGTIRRAGFGVVALGAAGLVTFAVAGTMANDRYDRIRSECGGRCTDPKYESEIEGGRTLDVVANVGLVAGGFGVLVGAGMIAFGGAKSPDPAPRAARSSVSSVSVALAPHGSWVGVSGSF